MTAARRCSVCAPGECLLGYESEQAKGRLRIGGKFVRVAQEDEIARHRELGVGETRPPVPEAGEQRLVVRLRGLQFQQRPAIDDVGVAVVDPHPLRWFTRAGKGRGGDLVLCFKVEEIGVASGAEMQEAANSGQELSRSWIVRLFLFGGAQTAQPAGRLQVAHAARRFLDVRLEAIDGVVILALPRPRHTAEPALHVALLGAQKLSKSLAKVAVEHGVATQKTGVEQADGQFEVTLVDLTTLFHGVNGMAGTQPGVPQNPEKLCERRLQFRLLHLPLHQQQQIHIGEREEFPAAVPAYRQ